MAHMQTLLALPPIVPQAEVRAATGRHDSHKVHIAQPDVRVRWVDLE
jgi:hypothetical protein